MVFDTDTVHAPACALRQRHRPYSYQPLLQALLDKGIFYGSGTAVEDIYRAIIKQTRNQEHLHSHESGGINQRIDEKRNRIDNSVIGSQVPQLACVAKNPLKDDDNKIGGDPCDNKRTWSQGKPSASSVDDKRLFELISKSPAEVRNMILDFFPCQGRIYLPSLSWVPDGIQSTFTFKEAYNATWQEEERENVIIGYNGRKLIRAWVNSAYDSLYLRASNFHRHINIACETIILQAEEDMMFDAMIKLCKAVVWSKEISLIKRIQFVVKKDICKPPVPEGSPVTLKSLLITNIDDERDVSYLLQQVERHPEWELSHEELSTGIQRQQNLLFTENCDKGEWSLVRSESGLAILIPNTEHVFSLPDDVNPKLNDDGVVEWVEMSWDTCITVLGDIFKQVLEEKSAPRFERVAELCWVYTVTPITRCFGECYGHVKDWK